MELKCSNGLRGAEIMIDFSDIQAAQRRIRGFIYETPLEELRFWPGAKNARTESLQDKGRGKDQRSEKQCSEKQSSGKQSSRKSSSGKQYQADQQSGQQNKQFGEEGRTPGNYYLKLESQQKTRSFKVRGAFSKLTSLSDREKRIGVLAVSSGNHGAAVSYAANLLEIPAIVVVPKPTPQSKIKLIKHYGADVRVTGSDYNEAHRRAHQIQEEEELVFVDPCSDPEVIAGQGTIGLEIMDQNPGIQTILVPVGGGGLITGISVAAKNIRPDVQVIGFQTEACPAMVRALAEDKFYEEYPIEDSICDALLGGVGRIPFEMAPDWLDEVLPVSEENIKKALLHLITEEKIMAEPSAVLGLAGVKQTKIPGETAIVISGGNIDGSLLRKLFLEEDIN